jgi:hypothetical protein
LQADESFGREAFAPLADGVAVAVEIGGDVLVVGSVVVGRTKDNATAQDQGVRRGSGPDQCLELQAELRGEDDRRAKRGGHERTPCGPADRNAAVSLIL